MNLAVLPEIFLYPFFTRFETVTCQLRGSNGEVQTVSLVKASGTSYGAPLLVSLALSWHLVFIASFFAAALFLAALIRIFTGKPAS